jgi:hypothetical protein
MIEVEQSQAFEATVETGEAGLVGTIEFAIVDNDGNTVLGPTSTNVLENEVGGTPTGNYTWNVPAAPATVGQYQILASTDGTFDPDTVISVSVLVLEAGATPTAPALIPSDSDSGPAFGPCNAWVSVEEVSHCCGIEIGSSEDEFEAAATSASQLLYLLTGKTIRGICQRVVRPTSDYPCGLQVTSGGYVIGYEGAPTDADFSKVLLPNYPVVEIVEVKIDGVALDADEYRLDGWRWLQRMDDEDGNAQSWPGPQRMGRNDDDEDTWSIRYLHGMNPPQAAVDAAAQLACEVYKQCPGNEGVSADCKLPANATRVTRQGITIELGALTFDVQKKKWNTGMKLVDAFLNAYNPDGVKQQPLIWSPDHPRMAREVGTALGS